MDLITIQDVRVRLGLESDDDSYDILLLQAMPLVTQWFEQYCDRGLALRTIVDEEYHSNKSKRIYVWAYPIQQVDALSLDGVASDPTTLAINSAGGYIYCKGGNPALDRADLIRVSYIGGYLQAAIQNNPQAAVPNDLAQAYADAVGAKCGITPTEDALISSSTPSSIKSIGLGGGALAVAFDTALSSARGGITGSYDINNVPTEVQNYVSVLDYYKRWPV